MFDDLSSPVREKYPGRDVCTKCLMTFITGKKAAGHAEGPLTCPVCRRIFWVGGGTKAVKCYSMGRTA